ncbi:MAG: hypothetical protein PHN57_02485 [Candidatus Omnitrophica bacterium]|nr:hypothetical protein [Candidatus Omnitrophota bacterium]
MMKLRLSSKNSVRAALPSLILFCALLLSGCSSSTKPTYLKENIPEAIEKICKAEYRLDVTSKLVGSTLWIYIPLENLVVKADKPEKYQERFLIARNESYWEGQVLNVD